MKKVEHEHAKKKGRSVIGKIVLYLFLFWIGSTALSALFITGSQMSDRSVGKIVVYAVIGVIVWQVYKRYKKKKNAIGFVGNPTPKAELNLSLNGTVNIPNTIGTPGLTIF